LCDVLGVPELKTDPRFQKRDTRKQNRKALTPLLEAKLAGRPTEEWVELLNAKDVPSGAILSLEDALSQPQVRHRNVLSEVPVEGIGTLRLFGMMAQFEKAPGGIGAPPPRLSAHTEEVLLDIGVTRGEVAAFKARGIV
jgi:crotonobetainyl-CoA:carnitine CoA-transferase CaiB-like acyl-CoA transferase